MKLQSDLLNKMINIFKNNYSLFPFSDQGVQLWSVAEEEYPNAYIQASNNLGLNTTINNDQLSTLAKNFCAEILKNNDNVIILINEHLIDLGIETERIVLHELAHAFAYSVNSTSKYYREINLTPSEKETYNYYGWQMWNEYLAEYLVLQMLEIDISSKTYSFDKSFKSLMNNVAIFPQKMGFFMSDFLSSNTTADYFFEKELFIINQDYSSNHLKQSFCSIDKLLKEKTSTKNFWMEDNSFLVELGKLLASFGYWYLEYFNQTESFLND